MKNQLKYNNDANNENDRMLITTLMIDYTERKRWRKLSLVINMDMIAYVLCTTKVDENYFWISRLPTLFEAFRSMMR